jgi:protein TonB
MKIRILLFIVLSGFVSLSAAQTDRTIYTIVEQMPEFPGGPDSLTKYIFENLRYPNQATVEGVVYVGFIVEPDGTLSAIEVVRGIEPNYDKEAVRIIKSLPRWEPGIHEGKPVRVKLRVPVRFKR